MKKPSINQNEKIEKQLIAKKEQSLLMAVKFIGRFHDMAKFKPLLEDLLFNYIKQNKDQSHNYRCETIDSIRELMRFTEDIAEIQSETDELMKPIKEAAAQQEVIKNKDQEIEKLRYGMNTQDMMISTQSQLIKSIENSNDWRGRKIESLNEEINLLKANPERRKGGTTIYFGKLSIADKATCI